MKNPTIGYEYEDLLFREQRIELLTNIKYGWGDQRQRSLTRRERYELRYLKLHADGGREGLAGKWYADGDYMPSVKRIVKLLDRYAYRNGCHLMLELCETCLLPREQWSSAHKRHWCPYQYHWESEHFAELLGAGQFLVLSCQSDDWASFHVYRQTEKEHPDQWMRGRRDSVGYLHLCRDEEYQSLLDESERGDR